VWYSGDIKDQEPGGQGFRSRGFTAEGQPQGSRGGRTWRRGLSRMWSQSSCSLIWGKGVWNKAHLGGKGLALCVRAQHSWIEGGPLMVARGREHWLGAGQGAGPRATFTELSPSGLFLRLPAHFSPLF